MSSAHEGELHDNPISKLTQNIRETTTQSSDNDKDRVSDHPDINAEDKNTNNKDTQEHSQQTRDSQPQQTTYLNPNSFYPTTVPPFELESQLEKAKLKDSSKYDNVTTNYPSIYHDYEFKDQFLVTHDSKWGQFVNNVGSNPTYVHQQRYNVLDVESSSSKSNYNEKESNTEEELERLRVRKEVFQNLNSGWGGEQRLNALYNLPVEEDYEFKDQNDRNEWVQYISKMKKLYYGPQSKDMNSDMEILSTTSQTAGNRDVHHQASLAR